MGGYIVLGILAIGWFAWLPTLFIRVYKMAPAAAGFEVGLTTTIAGVVGALVGGQIADWLTRRGARGGKLMTLVGMFCAWIFCAVGMYFSTTKEMALFWAFVFTFADGIGFMQYGNVLQEMFPPTMRGRSIAAWNICSSMFTYGIGPLMFGFASDAIFTDPATGLREALGVMSLPLICVGLASAWFARGPYDRARKAVAEAYGG
jgi:MFS family permease